MKYITYGIFILLFMSGCVRRVHHIPIESAADQNDTNITGTLYDTTHTEARYNLKPEPYSVGSKEKDPELLGPQRTLKEPTQTMQTATSQPVTTSVSGGKSSAGMSKSECVSMIGRAKFDRYSKRFGGESGAIKRCAILKKLKRG